MSSSTVKVKLSDSVVDKFYSIFGGNTNLSVTINTLLTVLLDEAELNDSMDVEETIQNIRERLA